MDVLIAALAVSCLTAPPPPTPASAPEPPARSGELWRDVTDEIGASFQHWNGATGQWYFPEINGSGVALFDYDNDGDLDVYWVQSALLGPHSYAQALAPPPSQPPLDRLWRNESQDGRLRFTDVTEASGLRADGYGMAVATADFDRDGWIDIYVGGYGANQMWRNTGPGSGGQITFEDVTERWRVNDTRWTGALAVFDYDRDGYLDLYLGNYLRFEIARHKACSISSGQRDYCHPSNYAPEVDLLFRNTFGDKTGGDGSPGFIDVSRRALGPPAPGPTLGLAVIDVDNDGRLDLYVANDDEPNQLWRNGGSSAGGTVTFTDDALLTGSAVNGRGHSEASMGVAAGDVDHDGDTDLFISHLDRQTNTLYINDGGAFRDETRRRGLGAPSLPFTGFGTAFVDGDLDGDLDLVVVNGAVQVLDELRRAKDPHPFHQPNQYFENLGNGRFAEATAKAGSAFRISEVSRGLAVGDLDNDGDPDLIVAQNNGPGRILLNQVRHPGNERGPAWIGLRLVAPAAVKGGPPVDQLGARARLKRSGSPDLVARVGIDGSYASSRDPRLLWAPGTEGLVDLEITWPDGQVESFSVPPLNRYTSLVRGTGATPRRAQPPSGEKGTP